ncbi:unnamed protein product [Aphanomyces euteiches]|uniref:AAA+ ATPase domain-containing protein n=1 Tax=Aphanomyces euteiches TaxID=100861 RepID=A0A6G0WDI8_9STRA|nr:hypothetical protein Ae201684_016147 [Aphanomyces euteiches]KAH9052091.1 hypothetical protein Ae201684P_013594 [Aphanomyces euteiches]KAH9156913.1 hypothetical protein AeRB84_001205 [Aphanomyces euteiches]
MGSGSSKPTTPSIQDGGNSSTSERDIPAQTSNTIEQAVDIALNVMLLYGTYVCVQYLYKQYKPMIGDMYGASESASKLKKRLKDSQRAAITMNYYESIIAADLVDPAELTETFADIGGLEHQKRELYDLVILPLQHPDFFTSSKLLTVPKGILLYGKPGTGKTLLAKAIAKESGAFFINLKISTLMSKWFGESQKLVKAAFSLAKKLAPCIIFIDEVDSFMGARSGGASDPTYNSMKTEFLALWDGFVDNSPDGGFGVVVLGATNRPADVDAAFLRRMPRTFEVDLPDASQRQQILQVHLRGEPLASDLDLAQIARDTVNYSGSDLKELCRAALMIPLREHIAEFRANSSSATQGSIESTKRPVSKHDFEVARTRVHATGATAYAYAEQEAPQGNVLTPDMLAAMMALGMQHFMQAAGNSTPYQRRS